MLCRDGSCVVIVLGGQVMASKPSHDGSSDEVYSSLLDMWW